VPRGQRDESLWPYSRLSRPEPLLFLPSSSSVALTRQSGTRSRSTTFFVVPGIEPGTSGSVARNSDHYTTEAVYCTHEAEWTPFKTHYFFVVPGIEPGTSGSVARSSDH
jgi:hypothetical protein